MNHMLVIMNHMLVIMKSMITLASRGRWYDFKEANEYCKQLAKENNLIFVNSDDGDGNDYLD